MDALDFEALLVRHEAALSEKPSELDGIALLTRVLCPSPEFLSASLRRARETGPRLAALRMADRAGRTGEDGKIVRRRPSRVQPDVESLDDVLARL